MPREVILARWCDICWAEKKTKTAGIDSYDLVVNGAQLLLDLCADHKDPRLSQILDHAVTPPGERKPGSKQIGKAMPCPVPGCQVTGESRHGLMVHISRSHPEVSEQARRQMLGYDAETGRAARKEEV